MENRDRKIRIAVINATKVSIEPVERAAKEFSEVELFHFMDEGMSWLGKQEGRISGKNLSRMIQLIRRMPSAAQMTPEMQAEMEKIEDCVECGVCMSRCPYGLETPKLLRKALEDYKKILSGEVSVN